MRLTNQIIKKINDHYTFCKVKYQAHKKAAEKYNTLYVNTTMPIIIISSITTILASYAVSDQYKWLGNYVAICSGITTVCQALSSFLEFKNKYQEHLLVSNKYIALVRFLENEITVNYDNLESDDIEQDEIYIKNLFERLKLELSNIQNSAPVLPAPWSDYDYSKVHFGIGEIDDVLIDINIDIGANNSIDIGANNENTPLISMSGRGQSQGLNRAPSERNPLSSIVRVPDSILSNQLLSNQLLSNQLSSGPLSSKNLALSSNLPIAQTPIAQTQPTIPAKSYYRNSDPNMAENPTIVQL